MLHSFVLFSILPNGHKWFKNGFIRIVSENHTFKFLIYGECRYTTDSIRRVATETLLPWLVNVYEKRELNASKASQHNATDAKKNDDIIAKDISDTVAKHKTINVAEEFVLDEYEQFDDYLEMVSSLYSIFDLCSIT